MNPMGHFLSKLICVNQWLNCRQVLTERKLLLIEKFFDNVSEFEKTLAVLDPLSGHDSTEGKARAAAAMCSISIWSDGPKPKPMRPRNVPRTRGRDIANCQMFFDNGFQFQSCSAR